MQKRGGSNDESMYLHDVLIAFSFYDPLFISLDGTQTSKCRFHTQKEIESMTFHLDGKNRSCCWGKIAFMEKRNQEKTRLCSFVLYASLHKVLCVSKGLIYVQSGSDDMKNVLCLVAQAKLRNFMYYTFALVVITVKQTKSKESGV